MASVARLALLAATLTSGCASQPTDPARATLTGGESPMASYVDGARQSPLHRKATPSDAPGASPEASAAYRIGPQDVLEISVFKVPELSRSAQVSERGTLNLALVGEIRAAGHTAQDVERDLGKRLGAKYLREPQVTVLVKEYNSQRFTVEGAVRKPGVFAYRGQATLLQAIAMAEGLDAVSDSSIVVFRMVEGKRAAARFDIDKIRRGTVDDPAIKAGDVVVVPSSTAKETFNTILKALPLAGIFALL